MNKSIFYITLFFILFSFVNIKTLNTIDSEVLLYEKNNIYYEDYYDISFFSFNILDIPKIFKDLDIKIISVEPEKHLFNTDRLSVRGNSLKKITSNLIEDYVNRVTEDGYEEESSYYKYKGFNIRSMRVICQIKDILELEKRINII